MAVRQKSNERRFDQAVPQQFLPGNMMPLHRWFHLFNGFRLTAGHKTTVSNQEGAKRGLESAPSEQRDSQDLKQTVSPGLCHCYLAILKRKFCNKKGQIKQNYLCSLTSSE